MFFPSSATTGYRPTAPRVPTSPPRRPEPVRTPSPRRYAPPPKRSRSGGCLGGCFAALAVFFVIGVLAQGCDDSSDAGGPAPTGTAPACPGRIAAGLPGGDGARLVQAFRTNNKQITLCRTGSGTLYYYGEFSDGREKGIAMKAEATSKGYEARNGEYRYVVHGGFVTVYQSGSRIGQEKLTPEPSPS
ncbi:hypothetical protein ACGFT2_00415 [Streptomyces sp. NPDC048514]|uniref:hypothetical protein n=1 Tax=Streptomyces sp. NPDC048514 TaxID=3365564 RepID=UPI00372001A3